MASRKEEIRRELKKKREKELEQQDTSIVDLQDQVGEDIKVEDFEGTYSNDVIPFSTTPQVEKKSFVSKIKGVFDVERSQLKEMNTLADEIIALEKNYSAMNDETLKEQTQLFVERLDKGETLDDILVEVFAVVREAAWRTLGLKAFKVQLIGGITLHRGNIAEMKTGEGKTLTSVFPVYLNALTKQGVHVVTVNDYLASRDKELNGQVFEFLGLTVGLNARALSPEQKQAAHGSDITYTTNAELGFDYLRDNMVPVKEAKVLVRGLHYALVDEVDSILIDESRTPLIISGGKKNTASLYVAADRFVKSLRKDDEYEVDIESKTAALTADGITKAEKSFHIDNLYEVVHTSLVHHINQALKANYTMARDVEYMVATEDGSRDIRNAKVMIIDQFTGRVMPGRQYSDGLHQAIEAKEGVPIKEETETRATITYQNFFRLFDKLAGMTGTAKTEEEEFRLIYNMRVIVIPTNRPVIRDDRNDLVYATKVAKYKAICNEVEKRNHYGQPILLGTTSVETSEVLSKMLDRRKIRHNVLNAKNHAKEAEIIARAGQRGAVTIATNMAGRGTDIKLGQGVADLGGLAVIGSERHESRRIDNQLRGRSGRQGDPGYSVFYVAFDDELMQRFAGERLESFTSYLGEEEAIEAKIISKTIESAQRRVEGQNFDSRKHVLEYDDVMRQQREIMYKERDDIMDLENLDDIMKGFFEQALELTIQRFMDVDDKGNQSVKVDEFLQEASKLYMLRGSLVTDNQDAVASNPSLLINKVSQELFDHYISRFDDEDPMKRAKFERRVLIAIIDYTWINHIDSMAKLRNGIYLRAYAQKNPLEEYTQEAFQMFEQMTKEIARGICSSVVRRGMKPGSQEEQAIPFEEIRITF